MCTCTHLSHFMTLLPVTSYDTDARAYALIITRVHSSFPSSSLCPCSPRLSFSFFFALSIPRRTYALAIFMLTRDPCTVRPARASSDPLVRKDPARRLPPSAAMSNSKWNPRRLRDALADLGHCPSAQLAGMNGKLLEACRYSLELKTLWAAYEAYEELPWGAWRAETGTVLAFLAWCRRSHPYGPGPLFLERGPPDFVPGQVLPMSREQFAAWLRLMQGTGQAAAWRASWAASDGLVFVPRADGGGHHREWAHVPCGFQDRVCCDFVLHPCPQAD